MSEPIWADNNVDEWYFTSSLFASLFFCLTYLDVDEINAWALSITAIHNDHWRERISKWLQGLNRFLAFLQQPETMLPPSEPYRKSEIDTLGYVMETAGIHWEFSDVAFMFRPYASFWDFVSKPKLDIVLKVLDTAFSSPD